MDQQGPAGGVTRLHTAVQQRLQRLPATGCNASFFVSFLLAHSGFASGRAASAPAPLQGTASPTCVMGNGRRGQRGSGKATVDGLKAQLAKTVSHLHTAEHKRARAQQRATAAEFAMGYQAAHEAAQQGQAQGQAQLNQMALTFGQAAHGAAQQGQAQAQGQAQLNQMALTFGQAAHGAAQQGQAQAQGQAQLNQMALNFGYSSSSESDGEDDTTGGQGTADTAGCVDSARRGGGGASGMRRDAGGSSRSGGMGWPMPGNGAGGGGTPPPSPAKSSTGKRRMEATAEEQVQPDVNSTETLLSASRDFRTNTGDAVVKQESIEPAASEQGQVRRSNDPKVQERARGRLRSLPYRCPGAAQRVDEAGTSRVAKAPRAFSCAHVFACAVIPAAIPALGPSSNPQQPRLPVPPPTGPRRRSLPVDPVSSGASGVEVIHYVWTLQLFRDQAQGGHRRQHPSRGFGCPRRRCDTGRQHLEQNPQGAAVDVGPRYALACLYKKTLLHAHHHVRASCNYPGSSKTGAPT